MIIIDLNNTSPSGNVTGNTGKISLSPLPRFAPEDNNEICICDFISCTYSEVVFASQSSSDHWKNDNSEFLFKRFIATDSVDIKLYKNGSEIALLNDNTYGTFYNGLSGENEEQLLYVGYYLNWKTVQSLHGNGNYQVKADLNVIGNVSEYESRIFMLETYSDRGAHKTVKIETTQNGNIIGSQFDYSGLNWKQSIRVPGTFGNPKPIPETNNYVNTSRDILQISMKMTREWSFSSGLINYEVSSQLIYDKMMANEILITDYNIYAESVWRRVGVFPIEIDKPDIADNPYKAFTIKFSDNKDIFTKRNY